MKISKKIDKAQKYYDDIKSLRTDIEKELEDLLNFISCIEKEIENLLKGVKNK